VTQIASRRIKITNKNKFLSKLIWSLARHKNMLGDRPHIFSGDRAQG
jgi:steroid 5-alpha reductase family enzyme